LSKLAAASMAQRRRGKIINMGSMYSYFGSALIRSYSAAKGAIIQLTRSMAVELAPHGIQVNAPRATASAAATCAGTSCALDSRDYADRCAPPGRALTSLPFSALY
jgi:NAD(P)-dependent dehydrogenase (short-subunit alcohol dehydrogenase family)